MNKDVGAVVFADQTTHKAGWSARAGERPRRVRSTADLDTETIWWTNLEYGAFAGSGLDRSPRFRGAAFLRTSQKALLKEAGLYAAPASEQVAYLAELLASTIACAYTLGLQVVPPVSLARGFRERALGRRYGYRGPQEIRDALERAGQPYAFCEAPPWRRGDCVLTLVHHRVAHAAALLALPVPDGRFAFVDPAQLPAAHSDLAAYDKPLLLRVEIDSFDPALARLINYGAGAQDLRRHGDGATLYTEANAHQWLSQPEFRLLYPHAQLRVLDALVAERFACLPLALPKIGNRHRLSPAFGLAVESLWSAVVRDHSGRLDPSPASVWLQAHDRAICMEAAVEFGRRLPEAVCQHYGSGRITLRLPDLGDQLQVQLAHALRGTDWLPPIMADRRLWAPLPDHPDAAALLQAMCLRGQLDAMARMDQALLAA